LGGANIRIWGRDGDWALIGYGLSNGEYRIGYVTTSAIPPDLQLEQLVFSRVPHSNVSTSLFVDDPIIGNNRELEVRMEAGQPFTVLGYLNDFWAYVEVDNLLGSGQIARGFVSRRSLGLN